MSLFDWIVLAAVILGAVAFVIGVALLYREAKRTQAHDSPPRYRLGVDPPPRRYGRS